MPIDGLKPNKSHSRMFRILVFLGILIMSSKFLGYDAKDSSHSLADNLERVLIYKDLSLRPAGL